MYVIYSYCLLLAIFYMKYVCICLVYFQVKALKKHLVSLEGGNFVIVNGMTGCGKSSLVVEVLNDHHISIDYFQVVYQILFILINILVC